jgi:Amt family ammonium transporter
VNVNSGDTAFMLISAALVLFMTPGLAFFYGGLVRSKNVVNTMMMSLVAMGIVTVQWVLWGYTLAFSPNTSALGSIVGNLNWLGLSGVDTAPSADYSPTVPHQAFMMYQAMFAIITPALISGAIVERMKFKGYAVFVLLWTTISYDLVAHWVWGVGGMVAHDGCPGFCRWDCCSHQRRGFGSCRIVDAWPSSRISAATNASS